MKQYCADRIVTMSPPTTFRNQIGNIFTTVQDLRSPPAGLQALQQVQSPDPGMRRSAHAHKRRHSKEAPQLNKRQSPQSNETGGCFMPI